MSLVDSPTNSMSLWLAPDKDLAGDEYGTVVASWDYLGQFRLGIVSTIDLVDIEHNWSFDGFHHLFSSKKFVVSSEVDYTCAAASENWVVVSGWDEVDYVV